MIVYVDTLEKPLDYIDYEVISVTEIIEIAYDTYYGKIVGVVETEISKGFLVKWYNKNVDMKYGIIYNFCTKLIEESEGNYFCVKRKF